MLRHPILYVDRSARRVVLVLVTLVVAAVPGLVPTAVQAADDPACVGKQEYRRIKGGISLQKLTSLLDGQAPIADLQSGKRHRVRWYAACDGWQPVKDVRVRYHRPVVGRRTVAGKRLAVYEPAPTTTDGPRTSAGGGSGKGSGSEPKGGSGPRHP